MGDFIFILLSIATLSECATVKNKFMQESTLETDFCLPKTTCDACSPYRTNLGSCNNLRYPFWGSSEGYYLRLMKSTIGYNDIGRSKKGGSLPNARKIRQSILADEEKPSAQLSVLWLFFAQFIVHDTVFSAPKASPVSCCSEGVPKINRTCAAFSIPKDDEHFSKYNKDCESVLRMKSNIEEKCDRMSIHQRSFGTHFLDLSLIYGNNDKTNAEIKAGVNGLLMTREVNGKEYTPLQPPGNACGSDCTKCYKFADGRNNQNYYLAYLHVLFIRLHNRIARKLQKINPHWDDYRLYEESRKINIAIFQKISYEDWLPLIIGESEAEKFLDKFKPEYTRYNPSTHPNTFQEFIFCFRQYHTFIRNTIELSDDLGNKRGEIPLADTMKCPGILEEENYFDWIGLGAANQKVNEFGYGMADAVGNRLFDKFVKGGSDLGALDINRGREIQQNSYCELIKHIHSMDCTNFCSLRYLHTEETIARLREIYEQPHDIDAFVGTLLEKRSHITGPTCEVITTVQFRNWKVGDRFWYEFGHWFTKEQIFSIKKVTLASIMCNSGNDVVEITEDVFLPPSRTNKRVHCDDLEDIDLSLWKDEKKNFRPICKVTPSEHIPILFN